ncbi:Hypothetical_protein [Hexamita inflata]|uniref:Hypothetical_protein n=1 Tax=Hexamita inflata TaxID=28002 RepID=A0AA86UQN3_9EUKA|nr:Hypothetical protein HINF_LOCUS48421 [Hexamita inflata]
MYIKDSIFLVLIFLETSVVKCNMAIKSLNHSLLVNYIYNNIVLQSSHFLNGQIRPVARRRPGPGSRALRSGRADVRAEAALRDDGAVPRLRPAHGPRGAEERRAGLPGPAGPPAARPEVQAEHHPEPDAAALRIKLRLISRVPARRDIRRSVSFNRFRDQELIVQGVQAVL